jgi:HlyD family secretion protein
MRGRTKGVIIFVLILIFAFVLLAFYFKNSKSDILPLRTAVVEVGDIEVTVSATGTLNPVTVVQVGTQISGTIAEIFVDYNSVVKKGQVIAQIDSTFLAAQVRDARAQLERAEAQLNQAERDLRRIEELYKKELVSQADYDMALTNYEMARAQLKSAQAQLERALINLKYSTIRAPIDGIVISRNVDVGQTVAASLQAPTLFTIANDLRKMRVEASVDEADIGKVRVGQDVYFTVDAYPDEKFYGKVSQIRLQPTTIQNVVNYTVIIDVDNPDLKLKPGMTATVNILIDRRENVLKISNGALRFKPDPEDKRFSEAMEKLRKRRQEFIRRWRRRRGRIPSGGSTAFRRNRNVKRAIIWVLNEDGKPKPVLVQLGISDGSFTEVTGGNINEGDKVIIGYSAFQSGSSTQKRPMFRRLSPF